MLSIRHVENGLGYVFARMSFSKISIYYVALILKTRLSLLISRHIFIIYVGIGRDELAMTRHDINDLHNV